MSLWDAASTSSTYSPSYPNVQQVVIVVSGAAEIEKPTIRG